MIFFERTLSIRCPSFGLYVAKTWSKERFSPMMTMTCLMGDFVLPSFLPGAFTAGAVMAEAVCFVTSEAGSPGLLGAELQAAAAPTIDVANNPNVVRVRISGRSFVVRSGTAAP